MLRSMRMMLLLAVVVGGVAAETECPLAMEQDTYDYVVVGAGTAGSAAAAELATALPEASVLLIDQGKDYSDSPEVMDNDRFIDLIESPYCEHHFSREPGLGSIGGPGGAAKKVYACVSKILGGASSLNFGGWYRVPQSDLEEWASLANSEEWTYDAMLPYFKKIERFDRPGTRSDDRGYEGVIPIRHDNVSVVHVHTGMIGAISEYLGVEVGDQDNNGREQSGINTLQVSRIEDGCWHDEEGDELGCAKWMRAGTSYNAFVRNPQREGLLPNLTVLQGGKVVKIDGITAEDEGEIHLHYVQRAWRHSVKARKEVLLSAGSWANPKIAMLSGIGDKDELASVGIETKVHSPSVGRHLIDHGVLWLTAMLNNFQGGDVNATATEGIDMSGFRGKDNPLPTLMSDFNTINLYFKSNDTLPHPDMELMTGVHYAGPGKALLIIRVYQNRGTSGPDADPTAGGTLRLRSDDPNEEMDATRGWYADEESLKPMLNSLKKVIGMVSSLTDASPMFLEPNPFTVDFTDDASLSQYIRQNAVSEMHLMGSMRMGADNEAVVDADLKVVGSNGRLRVADTSIFPTGVRGHPMAAAMAVGVKAAALIAADNNGTVDDPDTKTNSGAASTFKLATSLLMGIVMFALSVAV